MAQPVRGAVPVAPPVPAQPGAPAAAVPPGSVRSAFALERAYTVRFHVDLKLAIDAPDLDEWSELPDVPLPGRWSVRVQRSADHVKCYVFFGKVDVGAHGLDAQPSIHVENPATGRAYEVYGMMLSPMYLQQHRLFMASFGASATDPATYRIHFELHQKNPSIAPDLPVYHARCLSDLNVKPLPHDVRLFFPAAVGRSDAALWTSESLLTLSSPYFRTLFSSDLAETVSAGSKRARRPAASTRAVKDRSSAKSFEDSDDETDKLVVGTSDDALDDIDFSYKQVVVTQAAYSTYRAVLLWMQTGFIAFAPLSSSFDSAPEPLKRRTETLEAMHKEDPRLPYPVSPKSVYRLAHVLELQELESLAMRHFRKEALSLETAPAELFSELARDNVEWRTMILDWIMERWDEVEGCEGWTATMQRVEKGEIDGAASLMVEVLRRVAKRKGASSLPLAPRRASWTLLLILLISLAGAKS
ncbi:hypothetical protein DMC30DRAFT_224128 [Rhodotorula diobovata]|uniref:BTB domain-containing protein n=1 Tax=Rhodotorula diobovata TaxID=5288 RepID=A0A5C5FZA6_9BASI|nr:hypothetical protein DMC30DRAFT_224128 [Rhodotorula diobovata]